MSPRRATPPLVAAVKRDLGALAKRTPGADKTTEAALALELAARIVGDPLSEIPDPLSARVSAARELRELMAGLKATAPAEKQTDRLDELTARRDKRRAS